jgi:hypothetical protein
MNLFPTFKTKGVIAGLYMCVCVGGFSVYVFLLLLVSVSVGIQTSSENLTSDSDGIFFPRAFYVCIAAP